MSETFLEALMQLFALLTDVRKEQQTGKARLLVEETLLKYFNQELVSEYVTKFDFYLSQYHKHSDSNDQTKLDKEASHNLDHIIAIAEKLNLESEQEAKILLIVQVLDFLKKEANVSEEENLLIDTVAERLKIDASDYNNLKAFVLQEISDVPDKEVLLTITGELQPIIPGIKHIYNENQQVEVAILHVKSTTTFVFKYSGARNLYLNGNKVEQHRIYNLAIGSVIRTSRIPQIYYGQIVEKFITRKDKSRIIYRAVDIEYKFNNTQIGIHRFSFTGRSGQMVGIMGGSGAGKSTLLNVLNGNLKLSNGRISINGYDIRTERNNLHGVIGYVPQEDLLIEELTVYENLYFNAKLCFSEFKKEQISIIVERALNDFDLVEARDLVVGSPINKILSGGQRKRLNIALELIREPSVLFVDEPTSGLSSMDSEKVMTLLKRQALKGKLVIINIHQPSSDLYKMLDKLLMIDKGGHIIYSGNPVDAIVYFKQMGHYVNPEERECYACGTIKTEQPQRIVEARMVNPYGKLIRKRKVSPEEWYNRYLENFENKFDWKNKRDLYKKEALPPNQFKIPKRHNQFLIFFLRNALSKIKDKQYMLITFIEAPILAVILGFFTKYFADTETGQYIFRENTNLTAYLFMCVVVSIFLGLNLSAEEIIKDKKLLVRERFLSLSRLSYLSSKIAILFGISAIQTLSFVLIGNYMLEIHGLTPSYWLILFSTSACANMIGLNISSGLKSVVAIYISIPVIFVPQLLFSGVIVSFDKLHPSISSSTNVPVIGDLMISRWSYEALAVNQFINNDFERLFFNEEQRLSEASFMSNYLIPQIEKKANECDWYIAKNDTALFEYSFKIVKDEIVKLEDRMSVSEYEKISLILEGQDFATYNNKLVTSFLDKGKRIFQTKHKIWQKNRDDNYAYLIKKKGSPEAVFKFQERYENNALSDVLLNKKEVKQIILVDGRFIQKSNPIYQIPESKVGRSHFYAPVKRIGSAYIPTVVFNIFVIWLWILFFYVTLYFDVLRRMIGYFEKIQLRQQTKRLRNLGT